MRLSTPLESGQRIRSFRARRQSEFRRADASCHVSFALIGVCDDIPASVLSKDDRWSGRLIHMELKYIRTGVVSGDIEIVFSSCEVTKIQFVHQQGVFIEHGVSKHLAEGATMQLPPRIRTVSGLFP
ncbi:hypothetical protein PPGU19_087050 (plasmid) [Paraburkholderia sp. PGU19]|nr:hypothetical protein PPGU19_087050 [Paraburkholderia sp. PGU19]